MHWKNTGSRRSDGRSGSNQCRSMPKCWHVLRPEYIRTHLGVSRLAIAANSAKICSVLHRVRDILWRRIHYRLWHGLRHYSKSQGVIGFNLSGPPTRQSSYKYQHHQPAHPDNLGNKDISASQQARSALHPSSDKQSNGNNFKFLYYTVASLVHTGESF